MIYEYNATVLKVTDGDTLHLSIDLGLDIYHNIVIRLYGCNAYELHGKDKDKGLAAKRFVSSVCPVGLTLTLQTVKDHKEKYGRYLAIIQLPKIEYEGKVWENANIGDVLIELGLAVTYFPKLT
jgi:micrococcal nuclease